MRDFLNFILSYLISRSYLIKVGLAIRDIILYLILSMFGIVDTFIISSIHMVDTWTTGLGNEAKAMWHGAHMSWSYDVMHSSAD
jgi:hypothetical protein